MDEIKKALMPYGVYNKTQHSSPYFFKIKKYNRVLYYIGANHSHNPKDKQYPFIRRYWNEFLKVAKPETSSVAVEGGLRKLEKSEEEAIKNWSEGSFITFLAERKKYKQFSPEPDRRTLLKEVIPKYSKEVIQYYYFCISVYYWGLNYRTMNFEEYIVKTLKRDEKELGWKNFDFSLENMKKIHKSLFKGEFDELNTDFFYTQINPTFRTTIINCFSQDKGIVRDAFIIKKLLDHWKKGENLFIVFGYTHAIVQEPALKKLT